MFVKIFFQCHKERINWAIQRREIHARNRWVVIRVRILEYFTVHQTVPQFFPPLPSRQQVNSSMSMDKSTRRVNRSSSWGSIVGQVEWKNPTSFSFEVTTSMEPHAPTSSGLRGSFSENLNGTSSEQIFPGGHCDGPAKRRPWNSWGKFSFMGIELGPVLSICYDFPFLRRMFRLH